jgi:outer membrane lipoprotein-sorting protein
MVVAFGLIMGMVPLTEGQVFTRLKQAYGAAKTLKVQVKLAGSQNPATANIWFSRPDKLRVTGQSTFKSDYELLINGQDRWLKTGDAWSRVVSVEMGISSITGISGLTGTTVPSLLFRTSWGSLLLEGDGKREAKSEMLAGKKVYAIPTIGQKVWVDANSFFLVRTYARAGSFTYDARYRGTVVNEPVPPKVFVKPKS